MSKSLVQISYISLLSLLNSFLNFIFQIILARIFGASIKTDVFFLAFSIPQWVINITLFLMPITVIPTFSGKIALNDERKAWLIINTYITIIIIILSFLILLMIIFSNRITNLVANNLPSNELPLFKEAFIILSPIVLIATLSSIVDGIYYSYGRYLVPRIAPMVQALIMIVGLLLFHNKIGIKSAVYSTLGGSIIRFLVLAIFLKPKKLRFSLDINDNDVKNMFKIFIPLMISNIFFRSDVVVDRYLASLLVIGSISYLTYASKVSNIFLRISSLGIATVYFPKFSKAYAKKDNDLINKNFEDSINLLLFILFPIVCIVLLFNREILYVLFFSNKFSHIDIVNTANAFLLNFGFYFALPINTILERIFYSAKKIKVPIIVELSLVFPSIFLKILLMRKMDFLGVALGDSIVKVVAIITLFYFLKKEFYFIKFKNILKNTIKLVIASSISICLVYLIKNTLRLNYIDISNKTLVVLISFLLSIFLALVYFIANYILKNRVIMQYIERKRKITNDVIK